VADVSFAQGGSVTNSISTPLKPIAYAIGLVLCAIAHGGYAQDQVATPSTPPKEQPSVQSTPPPNKEPTPEPKAEEPKAEEPKAEEPKAEEPKAEEPKASPNSTMEDVPFIWVDFCITESDVCLSGVSARRKDGVWQVDLNDESIEALHLDTTKVSFARDDQGNWLNIPKAEYDESQLKITWSIGAENLQAQGLKSDEQIIKTDPVEYPLSAALNYSVSYSDFVSAYSSYAVGKKHVALVGSYSWDAQSKELVRGLTSLEYDQVSKHLRWSAGDVITSTSDDLGSGGLIRGIGVRRSFEQQPTLITIARPQMSGIVDRPGTLEVYSNNILISSQEVRPGPFMLENLGISTGRQNIKIVLRDVTGNRTTLSNTAYYGSVSLLAKGLNDYGFYTGKLKAPQFLNIPNPNDPFDPTDPLAPPLNPLPPNAAELKDQNVVQAFWRRGLNDKWTIGARVEASELVQNYGLNVATTTPIGEMSLSVGKSSEGGMAYSANYSYSSRYVSFGGAYFRQDPTYKAPSTLFEYDDAGIVHTSTTGNISFGFIPRISLGLQYSRIQYQNGGIQTTQTASISGDLFKKAQWSLLYRNSTRTDQDLSDRSVSLLLSLPLENRRHLSFTAEQTPAGNSYGGSFSQSRKDEYGYSYAGSASQSALGTRTYNLRADHQNRFGLFAIQADRMGSTQTVTYNASGALVVAGKNIFIGPPLGSGFALIDAPGAPKAPVLRESTPVGTTNGKGRALIRNLTPFYPSQIGFDPSTLDIDVDTGNVLSKKILPTAYTATKVSFSATQAQAIQVQLTWPNGTPIKYGSVVFDEPLNQTISLGATGMLWLEQVQQGTYEGIVSHDKGTARCTIVVPERTKGISDLGTLACVLLTGKGEGGVSDTEEPKAEEPKAEEPKAEEPKAEEPKAEEPKAEAPKETL